MSEGDQAIPEFPDVPAIVEVLNRHGVRYIVIGGAAVQFSIPEVVTHDVDFTPSTDADNLVRLSQALRELQARIRTDAVPEGLAFDHDGASLGRAKMWNLGCAHGAFDITFEPAGGGYEHLAIRARMVRVRDIEVPVADLADVVASKQLADRPKDRAVLPRLQQALIERAATSTPPDNDPSPRGDLNP